MQEMAKIELSKDIIEPIVRAQLQASIVSAMGRSDQLVSQVVQTMLSSSVDGEGRPSNRDYGKPLITWMAEKAIKDAALEAIKEWFAANKTKLQAQIKDALTKNSKLIAEKFVMGLEDQAQKNHTINITVDLTKKSY